MIFHTFKCEGNVLGSGCGTVGRGVTFRQHRSVVRIQSIANFDIEQLFTVNYFEKTKIKNKEAGNGPLKMLPRPYLQIFFNLQSHPSGCYLP